MRSWPDAVTHLGLGPTARAARPLFVRLGVAAVLASAMLTASVGAAGASVGARSATAGFGTGGSATAASTTAGLSSADRATLREWAVDTWKAFLAMAYPSGLVTDNIAADGTRAGYTSPTNIGAYMWSTVTARDLGIISSSEAISRLEATLRTLGRMERSHGFFYNWYDPATGAKLTTWPPTGQPLDLFLSTVDNGWLAAALMVVTAAVPQVAGLAQPILSGMDFSFFRNNQNGLLKGGFFTGSTSQCTVNGGFTCFDFGTLNTEPRIATYIGIARGQLPPSDYFRMFRTFPATCDWSWQEMQPAGVHRTYLGVDVFEGHYTYRGMDIVPSWGGSMFEALMPNLFVPEVAWGPNSWGLNHPLYVRAQIEHGLQEAQYGYWGFSPSDDPAGGYQAYGVDAIGLNPDGYPSNDSNTLVDYGFDSCPGRTTTSIPPASAYTHGIVTPHASFLAMAVNPEAAMANLTRLRQDFAGVYGQWGFYDAVDVQTGTVARYALSLDDGMIMAALDNVLHDGAMQSYFSRGAVQDAVKPLLGMESFTAGIEP